MTGPDLGRCPSCGASSWTSAQPDDLSYGLWRCDACGCHAIRQTRTAGAALYDADYYTADAAARLSGLFQVVWEWKRRSRGRQILRHAPPGARVCDVGCERGELLNVLKQAGCHVVGTQLSSSAAAFASRHFGIAVYVGELPDAPFARETFDAVLMLNVLEHLPDPEAYVAQVARMLAERGTFWIEVPNAASFTARVCGKRWLHHDPPHHLWAFDKPGIARLISRHGFAIEQTYDFNWEHGPIGCVQSWLNFLPGPRNVIFDIVRRGLSRRAPRLGLELLHVLAAGLLLPFGFAVATGEGLAGNGQVVLIRAARCYPGGTS